MQVVATNSYIANLYLQKSRASVDVSAMDTSSTATSSAPARQVTTFQQQTGIRGLSRLGTDLIGGLLSPDIRAQLHQQLETPSADGTPHFITGQQDLAHMIDMSVAGGAASASAGASSIHLTDDDFTFIRKATGYNLVTSGDAWMLVDDNGNFPPEGTDTKSIMSLVGQMDIDRQVGTLTGSVTKGYIEKLFARAQQAGAPYSEEFQQKVLSLFDGTDETQANTNNTNK